MWYWPLFQFRQLRLGSNQTLHERPNLMLGPSGRVFPRSGIWPKYIVGFGKLNIKWDTGFDQNTLRDSGNVKRDLDLTKITVSDSGNVKRDTEFDQNTVQDAELRKKTIVGMAMTVALRDAEFSWKRSKNVGWRRPCLPDPISSLTWAFYWLIFL